MERRMRPDNVATWLREHGYLPGSASQENVPSWLLTWSVPLSEIDIAQLERVLTAVTTKLDGAPMSREVARRRRTTLNAVLRAAYRRQLIDHNPLDKAEWKLPTRNIAVDISTVPSYRDVIEIVDHVAGLRPMALATPPCSPLSGSRHAAVRGHRRSGRRPRTSERRLGSRRSSWRPHVSWDEVHIDRRSR
jgi:hypothetical protein